MGANDYKIHRQQGIRAAPDPERTWVCEVTATPATATDLVRVRTVYGALGRNGIELGLATWVPPAGKEKPAEGDICLVQLDEQGAPWVVGWKAQEGPEDSGWLSVTPAGSWKGSPVYRKQGNIVRLHGVFSKLGGSGTLAFTLPLGFTPHYEEQFAPVQESTPEVAHVNVQVNGQVNIYYGGVGQIRLDGITFTID
jgi:hypothetical protein